MRIKRILFLVAAALLGGCGYDDFRDAAPPSPGASLPKANITVAALKEFYLNGGVTTFTRDYHLEGTVTTSDEAGNFYRTLFLEDATGAIEIRMGLFELHALYPPGRRLSIALTGLTLGRDAGVYQLGLKGLASSGYEVDYLAHSALADRFVTRGSVATPPAPRTVTIDALSDALLGTLVRVERLALADAGIDTWAYTAETSYNGTPLARDVAATDGAGRTLLVYTSGYADFAGRRLPAGPVDLTGILLKTGARYRIKLRDLDDVAPH